MTKYILIVFSFLFLGCFSSNKTTIAGESFGWYYSDLMEEREIMLNAQYTFVRSINKDGEHIERIVFPETKVVTHYTTYTNRLFKVKSGKAVEWSDEGIKVSEGSYLDNEEEGEWIFYSNNDGFKISSGSFSNGTKIGLWTSFREDGSIQRKETYVNSILEGAFFDYNEKGEITNRGLYEAGEVVEQINGEISTPIKETPARFSDCQSLGAVACDEIELLRFISRNIRYPALALEYGVQGRAIVKFLVEEDGTISNVTVLRGICQSISDEVYRVIGLMPKWEPGTIDGVPTEVWFTMPVQFKLE